MMRLLLRWIVPALLLGAGAAHAQQPDACAELAKIKMIGVEITKAAIVPAGNLTGPAGMPSYGGQAPAPALPKLPDQIWQNLPGHDATSGQ